MDDDIKVSIICITYNHEKYIRETLEGFIMQKTDFRYEIIVHDDASTDSTARIVKEYEKQYPKLFNCIYQKSNKYSQDIDILSTYIFPIVKGKYVAICEGDDFWCDENKLQLQYEALENTDNCCMSTHAVRCCNEDGSINHRIIPEEYYNLRKSEILNDERISDLLWNNAGYPFHTSSYFMKAKFLDSKEFSDWTKHPRDIDYLKKSIIDGKIVYISRVMSVRRLDSIDNWNSRMDANGGKARINLMKSDIMADQRFDKLTKQKYHEAISYSILKKCFYIMDSDYCYVKERKKMFRTVSAKKGPIKYRLFKMSPELILLIKGLKKRVENFLKG